MQLKLHLSEKKETETSQWAMKSQNHASTPLLKSKETIKGPGIFFAIDKIMNLPTSW